MTSTSALIEQFVAAAGAANPVEAMRLKARQVLAQYVAVFGAPTFPLEMDLVASFLGIGRSDEPPSHSADAELVPMGNGRVAIRVNPDRPETRKRFSVAHEVSHTFFPEYETRTWCRTDARFRRRDDPNDLVEMLCDVGASELLLPLPWFAEDAALVSTGAALSELAQKYGASPEATLRRYAELHSETVAAAFFSWKLKPTEQATLGNRHQQHLFTTDVASLVRQAKRLRLDYAIPSPLCASAGYYWPKDKSIEHRGPLYEAARTGVACEGDCHLDLGPAAGSYRVIALPLWTDDEDMGPAGESNVGAILSRIEPKPRKRAAARQTSASLLD
jgi:Zn-dependent peptidase ImmA (M78 family)